MGPLLKLKSERQITRGISQVSRFTVGFAQPRMHFGRFAWAESLPYAEGHAHSCDSGKNSYQAERMM